jgi:hypothetical protein
MTSVISPQTELELKEDSEQVYRPSQERIARICAEIRHNWSEREYRKRSAHLQKRWTVSVVSICLDPNGGLVD